MANVRVFILAALLGVTTAAPAFAAGIDACEKIKDADAYNRCLAGFGPAAKSSPLSTLPLSPASVGGEDEKPGRGHATTLRRKQAAVANSAVNGPAAKGSGPKIIRSAHGRMRMELQIPAR